MLQRPGDHLFVKAISDGKIQVGEEWHSEPFIISATSLVSNWSARCIEDLRPGSFGQIFELGPEVVLLGTGARQRFLPAELMMEFFHRGIGAEVMSTPAACRTFNILASEHRQVVAALMPIAYS